MRDSLSGIMPDSLSGILFALEGIRGSLVLLNGPTGCKFYHAATSDNQCLRQFEFDPLNYPEKWYFGQPRVPCTYLDSRDYVYGSKEKLFDAMAFLQKQEQFDLFCIVNSPGAALIGDDLEGIARDGMGERPVLTIQTPGFSGSFSAGYESALLTLLRRFPPPNASRKPRTVNLLGLSIFHRNWEGDLLELKRLCAMVGITVNCALGAGCTWEEYQTLSQASLNIVIHPEYGTELAHDLERQFGTPFHICPHAPIGFDATEAFFRAVCAALDTDPSPLLEESAQARARAYVFLSRLNSLTGLPRGVTCSVEGTWSEVYGYASFLVSYLGVTLSCASILDADRAQAKEGAMEFFARVHRLDALNADILETNSELLFANGNTIARRKLLKHVFSGLEISLPTIGYVDVIPKTYLGLCGALTLVEAVINGVMFL